jgi:glycosyltransferase involved in cell wall biosynthesis
VRVAYYSPLPPERSGIADYSALLLSALARRIEIEIPKRRRRRRTRVDISLYHVGNDPVAHGWIVEALRRQPGPIVLHDFVLHHLIAGLTLGRGDREGYLSAMFRDASVVGRLLGHGVIDHLVPPLWETRADQFPLVGEVLVHATGVIVHSRYVEEKVRASGYDRPVWRVPHPAWQRPQNLIDSSLPAGRGPVIGCFGNLTTTKRIPQLVESVAQLRLEFPDVLLLLAGRPAPGFALEPLLERLDLRRGDHVLQLDYVDEPHLWALIAASDVCVNLRWPTMGETSGTAIRALVMGRPLVVSDIGWFSELPDDAVPKVPPGTDEVEVLTETLTRLFRDTDWREELARAGEAYIRREHDLERVAEAYTATLEEAAGRESMRAEVLGDVAKAASEVGLEATSPELGSVAEALSEIGLGD